MIKIYYWRKNISRENRSIKRFELTHKMINFKIDNGLALVPLVAAIKWKDHIALINIIVTLSQREYQ